MPHHHLTTWLIDCKQSGHFLLTPPKTRPGFQSSTSSHKATKQVSFNTLRHLRSFHPKIPPEVWVHISGWYPFQAARCPNKKSATHQSPRARFLAYFSSLRADDVSKNHVEVWHLQSIQYAPLYSSFSPRDPLWEKQQEFKKFRGWLWKRTKKTVSNIFYWGGKKWM